MKVPLSWLKKYVPVSISPEELAHKLTMAGIEVDDVERIGGNWDRDKVVVGHVLKVDRHPNADRLTLPTVDLGKGETQSVVCGAPNVAAGQQIAFAREGALLFSPRSGKVEPLKAAKIRGVVSSGMVCSALELGLGEDHDGIVVLDDDAPTGMPLVDYMGDSVLDIEVTPNRPDCLSILGIAHEVAALTGERVTEPDLSYLDEEPAIGSMARIEIADPDLCYRYTASLVSGIAIGPSPRWMQDALIKAGQRPISSVVDITNYVMLEYGQPLHAFDFDAVKEKTIIVRAARPGEVLVTLDGEERLLNPPMLTIADATDATGLAGVMGGGSSEIHDASTTVLLEAANFNPINTRKTSAALRLSTEASYRFERGIRAELAPRALRRATRLILEIAGGKAARGIVDLYPGRKETPPARISDRRIKQVLGAEIPMAEVERVLDSLGFERARGLPDNASAAEEDSTLWVNVPYWRSDISLEDDLVEEVARIVGYDAIPTTMLSARVPHHEPQPMRSLTERIKDLLAAAGMQEIISYSLTTLEKLDRVGALRGAPQPLKIANPLSGEMEYLRTSLRGSMLETVASNRRTSQGDGMRLFEQGRVYLPQDGPGALALPHEREMLVGALSGPRVRTSWLAPQGDMDFFDAKGVVESMFRQLGVGVEFERSTDPVLHPGRTARLLCSGNPIGVVGEVRPDVLERFDIEDAQVAMFEIDLEALSRAAGPSRRYQSSSRFPESYRDLALIVDEDVPSAGLLAIIEGHKLVARATPFDVYSGQGVPQGKKSVAYRLVFQSASGTLIAQQVDRAQQDILRRLERELGAELRG